MRGNLLSGIMEYGMEWKQHWAPSMQTWTGHCAIVPWHRRPLRRTQAPPSKNENKKFKKFL